MAVVPWVGEHKRQDQFSPNILNGAVKLLRRNGRARERVPDTYVREIKRITIQEKHAARFHDLQYIVTTLRRCAALDLSLPPAYRREVVPVRDRPHQSDRRGKAVELGIMRGADLVGSVLNNASETFASFLDIYERDVLPTRELAKGTLGLCAVHFRRFRKQF
jgi:hypothetical protein